MVVVGPLNSSIRANLYISVTSYKMVLAISTKLVSVTPKSEFKVEDDLFFVLQDV